MKKIAVFVLFLFCVSAYSQGLRFFYHGEELGDTLNVSMPATNAENEITIQILNDSPDTASIMLRKEVITDLGGVGQIEKVSHEEVLHAAQKAEPNMVKLVSTLVPQL